MNLYRIDTNSYQVLEGMSITRYAQWPAKAGFIFGANTPLRSDDRCSPFISIATPSRGAMETLEREIYRNVYPEHHQRTSVD